MKISNIDKDFVDIIEYLDKNGYKPFASCDGVLEHHDNITSFASSNAYILFLKSPKIIDLMARFLKDKEKFTINMSNNTYKRPYYLYGNVISGNRYGVYFDNKKGELTQYFKEIIKGERVEQNIEEEKQKLIKLESVLEDEKTDINFSVTLNGEYEPNMIGKKGKINFVEIGTKDDIRYDIDIDALINKVSKKYGIINKEDPYSEEFPEKEFIYNKSFYNNCQIYFTDEHFDQMIDEIKYIKSIVHELPTINKDELNYGNIKFVEEKYEENNNNDKRFNKNDIKYLAESRNISRIKQMYTKIKDNITRKKNKVIGKVREGFSRDE